MDWTKLAAALTEYDKECARRKARAFPHGPDEPCTCDGCGSCDGRTVGCTCDIEWDWNN